MDVSVTRTWSTVASRSVAADEPAFQTPAVPTMDTSKVSPGTGSPAASSPVTVTVPVAAPMNWTDETATCGT